MDSSLNKNEKKRLKIYYSLLITVVCIIGVSFAWFRLYLSQSEDNTIASRKCFSTTLTEETSKIELTEAYPIVDKEGLKQTPFTFTLKNNCSGNVKVYITIESAYRESTNASYLNDNHMKVNISLKGATSGPSVILGEETLTELDNNSKGYIITSAVLTSNEERSYDLRVWMDSSTTTADGLNKSWAGKIVVISSATDDVTAPEGWYSAKSSTFLAALRDNNTLNEPLTTPGKEVSAHTLDDVQISNINFPSEYQSYYITYGDGWEANGTGFDLTNAAVTTDTYGNSYSSLVGKYFTSPYLNYTGSSTEGEMKTTTGLSAVYYVVSATASGFKYKELTNNRNITESLLASTKDDYGTSYYFRGAVKNN